MNIDHLEQVALAASQGGWYWQPGECSPGECSYRLLNDDGESVLKMDVGGLYADNPANADYIPTFCPVIILELITLVRNYERSRNI